MLASRMAIYSATAGPQTWYNLVSYNEDGPITGWSQLLDFEPGEGELYWCTLSELSLNELNIGQNLSCDNTGGLFQACS